MKTIQFRLKPDENLPMFSRLEWDVVDVSFREVLEQGIHPWAGGDQHHDMANALVDRLNQDGHKPAGLVDHHILHDLDVRSSLYQSNKTRFERLLENIQANVLFCEPGLDFPSLSETARRKLVERWNRELALRLARRISPSFQELRRFLKSKDASVKLKGEMDLINYDWSKILSLDDFANQERLIIEEAVNPLNFRSTSFLDAVADRYRRLRLVSSIDHVTLTHPASIEYRVPVLWQATRQGNHWRLRPNVGGSRDARLAAQEFASQWRRDTGKLCFCARTQDVIDMVDSESVSASFPGLRYTLGQYSPKVAGQSAKAKIPMYILGRVPSHAWSGDQLKSLLREYSVSTTGVKKVLVEKLAKLADAEYRAHESLLDGFFSENRFVRVSREVRYGEQFPVLGRDNTLKGLLLHVYALRHLRGDVVLDATYENDSCTVHDQALALVEGRAALPGGFLRVA